MSTKPSLAPTRRTLLRTAAWTAPAVSIAVAAPAFATSQERLSGAVASTAIRKYSVKDVKHVEWKLTFTNTGTTAITNPSFDFSFLDNSGSAATAFTVTGGTATWSVTSVSGLIATYNGTIAPGASIQVTVDFVGANNASGTVGLAVYSAPPSSSLIASGGANF